ncbi:hypothetical protein LSM04_004932 [Trypanosoma melophagium]|uniref:uncharacterized protein n=1 Tax=Trypanosoma melophagium TaxID=715481 RepID=UPI00351A8263|nr:hypothetical protein LSM04_004932 [Trypanosoma melophagium]
MSSSLFLSRRPYSFFSPVPTASIRRMRRVPLLYASLALSISRGISTGQEQKKEQPQQQQQHSKWNNIEELTLRLQDQLGKIGERVSHSDTVLQQQVNDFSLMYRQQAVMERRIVALEEEAARTQQKIAETTRLASDVVLQHRNVEALVHQMEKMVLKYAAASLAGNASIAPAATNDEACKGVDNNKQQVKEGRTRNTIDNTTNTNTTNTISIDAAPVPVMASTPCTDMHTSLIAAQVSALSTRLEALQARVEQLTMEKIVLDRVLPHAQQEEKVEVAVARVSTRVTTTTKEEKEVNVIPGGCSEEENTSPSLSPKALATLLRNTGAFPFKDNTGVTRISSQKVLIRGIPVNFGASEVRDLVSRVGNVITCVVRRIPTVSTSSKSTVSTPVGSKTSRYRSQQQEENGNDCKDESDHAESRTSSSDVAGSSTTATVQEEEEEERVFEITFQLVEQAVRAVLELDKRKIHGNYTISVEPVVSADILAALQRLERDSKKR